MTGVELYTRIFPRKRCCCNCRHNIRTPFETEWQGNTITMTDTRCEIDTHFITYTEMFEGWCRRWASERKEE